MHPQAFGSLDQAEEWLATLRRDAARRDEELEAALRRLNRAVYAHRLATADPYTAEVSAERALVARAGFGAGDEVAEGLFHAAWQLPPRESRTRRSMEAPEERFAAILGARERPAPAEELVLRARADLRAGRMREAALQARVALESLIADAGSERTREELVAARGAVVDAANAALRGEPGEQLGRSVAQAVEGMESALRRRRLGRDED